MALPCSQIFRPLRFHRKLKFPGGTVLHIDHYITGGAMPLPYRNSGEQMEEIMMKRIFLIVLDSFGIGAMPDSESFGDVGVNTLASCAKSEKLHIPNLPITLPLQEEQYTTTVQ